MDQTINCTSCGQEFIFTAGEQGFLRDKFGSDFAPPKRCRSCRRMKKAIVNEQNNSAPPITQNRAQTHVWLMVGASGSGKSTYIAKHADLADDNYIRLLQVERPATFYQGDVVVLSADDVMFDDKSDFQINRLTHAHDVCFKEFHEILRMDTKDQPSLLIVDNPNTSPWELAPYVAVAMAYEDVELKIITLPVSWQKCACRTAHDTPAHVIRAQARRLERMLDEWPTYWPKPEYVLRPPR